MVDAVIFDLPSLLLLSNYSFEQSWFASFELPTELQQLKRVVIDDMIYILSNEAIRDDIDVVIINLSAEGGIFSGDELDQYIFSRIETIVRSVYTNTVNIPFSWHARNQSSLQSIYAGTKHTGGGSRLHYDTNPAGTRDIYIFYRSEEPIPFNKVPRLDHYYLKARDTLTKAIEFPAEKRVTSTKAAGITLNQQIPSIISHGLSLDDWYKTRLTEEQRAFVQKPYEGPVRLRGSAGTGKTLSLAIKFLFDGIQFEKAQTRKSVCFLTHSAGTVDNVRGLCEALDPIGLTWRQGKFVTLQIRTLYDLAYEYLRFDADQLKPLSLDGREGRQLQAELIGSILSSMQIEIAWARFSDISVSLRGGWADTPAGSRQRLVVEIMNEFGSVLDADGVWAGTDKGEKYAKGQLGYRPTWLMSLPLERDRRFILDVHLRYRRLLSEMNTLSVDQMVADFNSFLERNTWDQLRKSKGFDALFVDELHLFTSIERQVLHKLIRVTATPEGIFPRPPIFMAYDVKQSPRDSFTQLGEGDNSLFSASTKLQNSDLVRLSKIFRYTPQIADFLYDLDAEFPAMIDLAEWEAFEASTEVDNGERPTIQAYKNEAELLKIEFDKAFERSRKSGGGKVAILCVNEALFDRYTEIARKRFEGKVIHITSREPIGDLRHSGKKVIFSMPEYVAGLQFDTVRLIHIDAEDAPKGMNPGERRRLISSVYLGASRAERELSIACCETRGGHADFLNAAESRGTLVRK